MMKIETSHNGFKELPEELKIEILSRIEPKPLARLLCVSKQWYRLIIAHCFPKPASSLAFHGILIHTLPTSSRRRRLSSFFNINECIITGSSPSFRVPPVFYIGPLRVPTAYAADCCNGLYLFHRMNQHEREATPLSDSYYVFNSFTKQWATVAAPKRFHPSDMFDMQYAALAYDPFESCFFRIFQFGYFGRLKVYSSETRGWSLRSIKLSLDNQNAVEKCLEGSLYLKGAVYRLSKTGHLVRFAIRDDKEVSTEDEVCVIDLPAVITAENGRIGMNNNRIHMMAFDEEFDLCIWVLLGTDSATTSGSGVTYEWSLRRKLSKIYQTCGFEHNFHIMMGFHPYSNVVYIDSSTPNGALLVCIDLGDEEFSPEKDRYELKRIKLTSFPYDRHFYIQWHSVIMFSLFNCPAPFASGLSEDVSPNGMSVGN